MHIFSLPSPGWEHQEWRRCGEAALFRAPYRPCARAGERWVSFLHQIWVCLLQSRVPSSCVILCGRASGLESLSKQSHSATLKNPQTLRAFLWVPQKEPCSAPRGSLSPPLRSRGLVEVTGLVPEPVAAVCFPKLGKAPHRQKGEMWTKNSPGHWGLRQQQRQTQQKAWMSWGQTDGSSQPLTSALNQTVFCGFHRCSGLTSVTLESFSSHFGMLLASQNHSGRFAQKREAIPFHISWWPWGKFVLTWRIWEALARAEHYHSQKCPWSPRKMYSTSEAPNLLSVGLTGLSWKEVLLGFLSTHKL